MELSKQSVQDKLLRARLGCIIRKFPTKRNKAKIISIIFFGIDYFEVLNAKMFDMKHLNTFYLHSKCLYLKHPSH